MDISKKNKLLKDFLESDELNGHRGKDKELGVFCEDGDS